MGTYSEDSTVCIVPNCETYSENISTTCVACSRDFRLDDEENTCDKCEGGLISHSGITCYEVVINCKEYDDFGNCI